MTISMYMQSFVKFNLLEAIDGVYFNEYEIIPIWNDHKFRITIHMNMLGSYVPKCLVNCPDPYQ